MLMEKRRKVVSILPFVSYGSAELMENECIRDTRSGLTRKCTRIKRNTRRENADDEQPHY